MATTPLESCPRPLGGVDARVLLVEDDSDMARALTEYFRGFGLGLETAPSACDARRALETGIPDLVLLDLGLPDCKGEELLAEILGKYPGLPVVVATGHNESETARECLRRGACDYLTKPYVLAEVQAAVRREFRRASLKRQARRLEDALGRRGFSRIVGDSPAMKAVRAKLAKAAPKDIGVLISGETGVGKDVAALALHEESPRAKRPFLALDCGALPQRLLESELFGYEKGAFTGADVRKRGRLETAEGGTLFLDEVANLPTGLQAKLLRVLQERRFRRIGAREDLPLDVRVVAATNADLGAARASGAFRDDLFYRLAEIEVEIPPLRERGGDLEILLTVLLDAEAAGFGRETPVCAEDVLPVLKAHSWPGNVRELRHALRRALLVCGRRLEAADLGLMGTPAQGGDVAPLEPQVRAAVAKVESELIQRALAKCHWVRQEAAALLEVDVKTLYKKMRDYGLA
jgi:DNA-binding NtrC family response regulator